MARILVTGATGFVGRNIVQAARGRSHGVVAAGGPSSMSEDVVSIDVGDPKDVDKLLELGSFDAVIHSAGIAHRTNVEDDAYRRVNAAGCQNVARLALELEATHFVLISSVLVYGRKGRVSGRCVSESDECRPDDAYAASKLEGEILCAEVCGSELPLTILRPSPVLGENGRGNFDRLMRVIDSGRFLRVGSGENMRNLVYVGDVADAAVKCVEKGITGTFNLATSPVSMRDLVDVTAASLGRSLVPAVVPNFLAKAAASGLNLLPPTRPVGKTLDNWLATDVYCTDKAEAAGIGATTSTFEAVRRAVAAYRAAQ